VSLHLAAVFTPRRMARLLAADAKSVWRDPILGVALGMSLLVAPGLAAASGAIDGLAAAQFGIAGASRLLVPMALVLPAMLVAWMVGFLLLEDRDDGALLAIAVTPVGRTAFFAWRAAVAALLAGLFAVYGCVFLAPGLSPAMVGVLAIMAGSEAVAAAVILPALARNKVEGLALTKLTNLAALVPFMALLPAPWRWLGGIVPTYWIGELLLVPASEALPLAVSLPLAAIAHAAALVLVFRLAAR
jgi:fluoroquinolone transport system permease protein